MPSSSLDLGNLPDAGAQLVAAAAAAAAGADDQGGGVVIEGMSIPVSIQEGPPGMPTLPAIGTLPTIPAIGAASWPCRGMPGGGACVPISNETVYTSFPMPFEISNVREKNASGALLCLVVGCNKNAQGRSTTAAKAKTDAAAEEGGGEANPNPPRFHGGGGFCRYHHNLYLIQTGQVESWDCTCGQSVLAESDRCGKCHRWKGGVKRTGLGRPAGSTPVTKKAKTSDMTATLASVPEGGVEGVTTMPTLASDPTDIQISNIREVNAKGRSLCKVVGCDKLDQAKNDGFCRKHYRLLVGNPDDAGKDDSANLDPADMENWNCPCGQLISYQQKRCGKCSKWKGGTREPYKTDRLAKKTQLFMPTNDEEIKDGETSWTCQCGSAVPSNKTRCGKCHHWRGGKRKGGWTLKAPSNNPLDDKGIDWSMDWECCGESITAEKRRCGKCNGWRGGKRVAKDGGQLKSGDEGPVFSNEEGLGLAALASAFDTAVETAVEHVKMEESIEV